MYFIYVLRSIKNGSLYIGRTANVEQRIAQHNAGKSSYTRKYIPWVCVYFEGYLSEEDAKSREKKLKNFGKAYGQLKGRIISSLKAVER